MFITSHLRGHQGRHAAGEPVRYTVVLFEPCLALRPAHPPPTPHFPTFDQYGRLQLPSRLVAIQYHDTSTGWVPQQPSASPRPRYQDFLMPAPQAPGRTPGWFPVPCIAGNKVTRPLPSFSSPGGGGANPGYRQSIRSSTFLRNARSGQSQPSIHPGPGQMQRSSCVRQSASSSSSR